MPNEKKWWETTGGILSIISILLTTFLSWDTISEKLFGKYSDSSLVGVWTYVDTDEVINDGLNLTCFITYNGRCEFKKKGRFYKNTDITLMAVYKSTSLLGDKMQKHSVNLTGITSEGKYELIDDNIRYILERTNIEQKIKEQIGDNSMFSAMYQGLTKNNATERKIVKLKGNSMILDNLEGTDKVTFMKK